MQAIEKRRSGDMAAKAALRSKAKAKAKGTPETKAVLEHDREADEVLSEALELEQEEQEVKNDVRLEADEDEKQPKKSKGKKKRGKKSRGHLHEAEGKDNAGGFEEAAQGKDDAAGCGDGDHAAPKLKGVKRRLEFDKCEEAGDELWPGVEDQASTRDTWDAMDADAEPPAGLVVKKKKRKMKKKGGRKSKRIVAKTPTKKNDDEAASAGQDEPEEPVPAGSPAGVVPAYYKSSGWTPRLAKCKRKSKPKYDTDNPMPKSRKQIEAKKDVILKDLRQLRLLDNSMLLPTDFSNIVSFTLNPSPKVVEENGYDGEGARSIGVLLQGGFYVANVPPARLAAINKYTTNAGLKANKNDGVNLSWKMEDLGDLQRVYRLAKKVAGWLKPYWPLPKPTKK
mmetsp:Transcript_105468/g.251229  ORF Transcript_105468/g.251229 Transcript_105468/m.251229 type:complete len:395 (+) Transcript_105468:2824-4008(+)